MWRGEEPKPLFKGLVCKENLSLYCHLPQTFPKTRLAQSFSTGLEIQFASCFVTHFKVVAPLGSGKPFLNPPGLRG